MCAPRMRHSPLSGIHYHLSLVLNSSERKLCPFLLFFVPATAEGFEEMNHCLHPSKRALSELILGRE